MNEGQLSVGAVPLQKRWQERDYDPVGGHWRVAAPRCDGVYVRTEDNRSHRWRLLLHDGRWNEAKYIVIKAHFGDLMSC